MGIIRKDKKWYIKAILDGIELSLADIIPVNQLTIKKNRNFNVYKKLYNSNFSNEFELDVINNLKYQWMGLMKKLKIV